MVVMAMGMAITVTIILVIMIVTTGTAIIMTEDIGGDLIAGDEKKAVTPVSGYTLSSPSPPFWGQEVEGWLVFQGR